MTDGVNIGNAKHDTSLSVSVSLLGASATVGVRLWPLGIWFLSRVDGWAMQVGPFYAVVLRRMTAGEFVKRYTEANG